MKIKLIAIDLDGTLLTEDKQITQATAETLREAMDVAGVRVVLASARPPRTVLGFYRQLRLDTPAICCNGALVYMPATGQILIHRPIPTRLAVRAVQRARQLYPKIIISAEIIDRWYTTRFSRAHHDSPDTGARPDVVGPVESWLNRPATKLLLIDKQERLSDVGLALREELADELTIAQTEENLLQVIHRLASKGRCLRSVAAQLGIDRSEVMAAGDNANDVGMLRWARLGVAMGNASPKAMEAADYVTDTNDADGLAAAVRRAVLDGQQPGRPLHE